ncbi:MAG: M20 family metallopeptidase [Saprospiraceae bacterium]|nr:M20 family metallopeptidase [Saprospiraceae bacterium]
MTVNEHIRHLVEEKFERFVSIRRHLHQNPELSFQEERTSAFIQEILKELGIPFTNGWAGHGIVAIIEGEKKGGKVVGVRADMDALPIQERNEVEYASRNKGVMHACGHDVHTTSLLGAAMILNGSRDYFGGTVKLIFQPGEEKLPGGASIMIKEGVLENPRPDIMLGLHVHPPLEAGKIGMKKGLYMASADEIYMTVRGQGGHAALPQDCVDPILIGSEIIMALQSIISRRNTPTIPSVLSFGKINSEGGATNVIPNSVRYEGTFRTMDESFRQQAHELIVSMAENIARAHGGSAEIDIKKGYPSLINDHETTEQMMKSAMDYLGHDKVVDLPPRMTAEDFAYFSHEIPACFFRLGTGNKEKGITSPVHTDTFDIDEDALKVSTGVFSKMVIDALQSD